MKMRLATLLVLTPVLALADEVFGDAAGCALHRGEPPTGDNLFLFDFASVKRMESDCPVVDALQVGGGATLLTVACRGEGETWEDFYMVETTSESDTLIIYPSDYPELRTELSKCN